MVHTTLQASSTSAFSKPIPSSKSVMRPKDLSMREEPILPGGPHPLISSMHSRDRDIDDSSSRCRSCSPCGSVDSTSSSRSREHRHHGDDTPVSNPPSPSLTPPTIICSSPTAKSSSTSTTTTKLSFSVDSIIASDKDRKSDSEISEGSSTKENTSHPDDRHRSGLRSPHQRSSSPHCSPSPPAVHPGLLAGHPHLQHPGSHGSFSVEGILGKPPGLPEHLAGANPYLSVGSHPDAAKWSPAISGAGGFPAWLASAQGFSSPPRKFYLYSRLNISRKII